MIRQIPLPLIEEVHKYLQEMLDLGAIHPSQSAWCDAVVLVRKKDSGLHSCTDFWHLNTHTRKDLYPLPRIQEALECLVGAGHFLCLDLKSGFWQIKMDESLKQYTTFIIGNLGFFECNWTPFGLCICDIWQDDQITWHHEVMFYTYVMLKCYMHVILWWCQCMTSQKT